MMSSKKNLVSDHFEMLANALRGKNYDGPISRYVYYIFVSTYRRSGYFQGILFSLLRRVLHLTNDSKG